MNLSQLEHAFESLMHTSLQSFRFLPQNPRIPHPARAAEITRMSLQSLMQVLFDAFYFVLLAVHDCDLHTQDVFFGIPSDTRGQDEYPATAYCEPAVRNDTLNFY